MVELVGDNSDSSLYCAYFAFFDGANTALGGNFPQYVVEHPDLFDDAIVSSAEKYAGIVEARTRYFANGAANHTSAVLREVGTDVALSMGGGFLAGKIDDTFDGARAARRVPMPGNGWTAKRAYELKEMIPSAQRGRITMGVGLARDPKTGKMVRLISTSEPAAYLRPGVALKRGERLIAGSGHAEADIVNFAKSEGLELLEIGATRPICEECAKILGTAVAVTPFKNP